MRKFRLEGTVLVSVYTEVEAETLEEAIEEAMGRGIQRGSWRDNGLESYAWVNEEYDGEV